MICVGLKMVRIPFKCGIYMEKPYVSLKLRCFGRSPIFWPGWAGTVVHSQMRTPKRPKRRKTQSKGPEESFR